MPLPKGAQWLRLQPLANHNGCSGYGTWDSRTRGWLGAWWPEGWSRDALILITKIILFAQKKWDRASNGKVNISMILAVFVMGSHHSLWGRIHKTDNDCKEDGDKEQGRDISRLYLALSGKEENMHQEEKVPHVLQGYPEGNIAASSQNWSRS